MAQVKMAMKAYKFKKAMDEVEKAKINAERARRGLPPLRPWYEDCYINVLKWTREVICEAFCPCCVYTRRRHMRKCCSERFCVGRMFNDGSYENELLKNVLGYLGGMVFTTVAFFFMIYQLNYSPNVATPVAVTMAIVLGIGLAFSTTIRCLFFLAAPQLFSSKGRTVLLAYIFALVLSGPVFNFTENVNKMADSMSCGQELANNATKDAYEQATSPVNAIIDKLRATVEAVMAVVEELKQGFIALKDLFAEVCDSVGVVFNWLDDIVSVCNEKMGAPHKKCVATFDVGIKNCRKKLGAVDFLCEIANGFKGICNIAKIGQLFCNFPQTVAKVITDPIKSKVNKVVDDVYDMMYVNVTLFYAYNMTLEQTRSSAEVRRAILGEIRQRTDTFSKAVSLMDGVMAFAVGMVIVKTLLYRHKFLTKDRYDNHYVTFHLRDIDERREEMEKETILPLKEKEARKYIPAFSWRLARNEGMKLLKGLTVYFGMLFHVGFYMTADYALYWLLDMIRLHADVRVYEEVPGHLKMHVEGNGLLADIYRTIITSFDSMADPPPKADTTACLPDPNKPDIEKYKTIGILLGIYLTMLVCESYGLRLRHTVCASYYPRREKERAVWLYNHILQRRGGLVKFMRRQMRRAHEMNKTVEKISIRSRLVAQFPCLRKLIVYMGFRRKYCIGCRAEGRLDDFDMFKHCSDSDCKAIYCIECFTDINNMCTVCMRPVDYGDFSDVSEERDSSDEEEFLRMRREQTAESLAEADDVERQTYAAIESDSHCWRKADVTHSEWDSDDDDDGEDEDADNQCGSVHRYVSIDIFQTRDEVDDDVTTEEEVSDVESIRSAADRLRERVEFLNDEFPDMPQMLRK